MTIKKGFGIFHLIENRKARNKKKDDKSTTEAKKKKSVASSLEESVVILRKELIKEGTKDFLDEEDAPPAVNLYSYIEGSDIAICFPDYARSSFYYAMIGK